MASLTIQNVTKRFGTVDVLKGISLSIDSGDFLVLVGPSGCGKSTLLNLIAGLEKITCGEIKSEIGSLTMYGQKTVTSLWYFNPMHFTRT